MESQLEEAFSEITTLINTREQIAFLIDDAIRYRKIIKFIGGRLNSNCMMVCCLRADPDDGQFREISNELGGAVRQIDLNRLSNEELLSWDQSLERWGLWEQRISHSPAERREFLMRECGAENRSIVLSLFRNSKISMRIEQIVNFFLKGGTNSKAFAALLISSLCQKHVSWESIVLWLSIDEAQLKADLLKSDISDLFLSGRDWNFFTSSQLAEYILKHKFVNDDKDTIIDVFSKILIGTADSASDTRLGLIFRENLKELMKFRLLTRLFGDDVSALKLIDRVYKRLSQSYYIRKNPQFWLQYAMSRIEANDLDSAETYLNTALGLAKERGKEYSPYQILDQRSRLYFRKNSVTKGKFKHSEIKTATDDLTALISDKNTEIVYLFRSGPIILDFIETQIDDIDQDMKTSILNLLEKIKELGRIYDKLPRSQKGETRVLKTAIEAGINLLRFA